MFKYSDNYNKIVKMRAEEDGPANVKKELNKMIREELEEFAYLAFNNHFIDPSTGTLRELASIFLSDAANDEGQHGSDGSRDGRPIECKPKIFYVGVTPNRANGYGSINDHSFGRHSEYTRKNLIMQQSQFFDGTCAWVVEFPYNDPVFYEHMEKQIAKIKAGRTCGEFTYLQWKDCPDLVVRYLNIKVIKENRSNITGGCGLKDTHLYKWLLDQ